MSEHDLIIYPKRQKGEDGHRTFSIRIREELADKLNEMSAQTGHSRNELIGLLLEFAIGHCTIADK